jgi:hypothetical protein
MYIAHMLDEIFCTYLLGLFDLWFDLAVEFLYCFFVWMTYLLVMGGIKSPHTSVLGSICDFLNCFIIHMCIQGLCHFSPPATTPSLTTHSTPSLSPPPPQYPAETILPLFLILF